MRRSLLPGMRYPRNAPESNHLLTVRGATLQILATSPVVRTSFTLLLIVIFSSSDAWNDTPIRADAPASAPSPDDARRERLCSKHIVNPTACITPPAQI